MMKLQAPGFGQNRRRDDAKTMKLQAPGFGQNRRRDDAKTMKLQAPGFGQNQQLGFIRCFFLLHFELSVASFFFVLWIF